MREGLRIVDSDRHVIEPIEMWKEYLPPEYRAGAPYEQFTAPEETLEQRVARLGPKGMLPITPTLMLDGQPAWQRLSERTQVEMAWAAAQRTVAYESTVSPSHHLRTMDQTGMDAACFFPTMALFILRIDGMEPVRATAFARAYNAWLRDFCSANPQRLRAVGALCPHDPEVLPGEVERLASFGWKAVAIPPNPVNGRTLGHPAYEPFWAACERHSIGVALHEGSNVRLPSAGAERFTTRFAHNAASHPLEAMLALASLLEGGVLERHPRLRVGFFESGCGWLPYWLWRMDSTYEYMKGEVAENVRMKPSEYFRRHCVVAIEPGEPGLQELIRMIGTDNLVFGTDYPHTDHGEDIVDHVMELRSVLPEETMRKLLWDNPARFYGIDG